MIDILNPRLEDFARAGGLPPVEPYVCCGCGAPADGLNKPCDCATWCGFKRSTREVVSWTIHDPQRDLLDRSATAISGLLDGIPLPATVNEYELVQCGCDPREASVVAGAYKVLQDIRATLTSPERTL